jgi:hypothetical protein
MILSPSRCGTNMIRVMDLVIGGSLAWLAECGRPMFCMALRGLSPSTNVRAGGGIVAETVAKKTPRGSTLSLQQGFSVTIYGYQTRYHPGNVKSSYCSRHKTRIWEVIREGGSLVSIHLPSSQMAGVIDLIPHRNRLENG